MSDTAELVTSDEEREREAFLRSLEPFPLSEDLDDQVNNDVYLDHLGEQLREREEEIARTRQIAERRIAMVQAWERDATERSRREVQWLRMQIEAHARGYNFGKKKSRSLPNVTFGYRLKPARLEIIDPGAALAFARENGLPIKEMVQVTPLKDYVKTHGIIPDGTEYVEGSDEFFVKAGG